MGLFHILFLDNIMMFLFQTFEEIIEGGKIVHTHYMRFGLTSMQTRKEGEV
jgi:hypothetical protein